MRILRNKKILILSITAIALLTLTLGVSYAYFTATVTGNDSAVVTKIVAGILDVDFTISDRISNDNIILIKDEKREEKAETLDFTVSNNGRGTLDAVYYVYLTDLNITNNLKSQDFKWELIKNDDTVFTGNFSSAETNTDFTITSETNNGIVIPVKQELSVGQIDRYKLRIWLSETKEDQNNLLNGSFSGKVRVTSTQLTGSEKYVVFKDQSGTQLGKKIISDGKTNYTMDISSVDLTGSTNIYCNNGGIPTISNNTLNIGEVTDSTECKISNDIMDTIANLPNTKTGIVMTNDQSNVSQMKIISSKEVVIDLNGKTISTEIANNAIFQTAGILDITSSNGKGSLTSVSNCLLIHNTTRLSNVNVISTNAGEASAIQVYNYLEVNEGTYIEGPYGLGSFTYAPAKAIINGGEIYGFRYQGIQLNGSNIQTTPKLIINDGIIRGNNIALRNNSEVVEINGGSFEGYNNITIYNSGTMNITGGIFVTNTNKSTIFNYNKININQSDKPIYITSNTSDHDDYAGIYNKNDSILNITANTANQCTANYQDTTSGLCIYNTENFAIKSALNGQVTINGGSYYTKKRSTINNESSTIRIKNAVINSEMGNALYNGNYFPTNSSSDPGTYNICSSTIRGRYEFTDVNTGANISYSNDNIFTDGTNLPASSRVNGTITATGSACSW